MQTRPLPETPDARSPAGAEIRYLMGGTTGDMIHSTVPPGQVNRATVHATVYEFWHVLWVRLYTDNGLVGLGETWYLPQAVSAVIHDKLRAFPAGEGERVQGQVPIFLQGLPFPGEHRRARGGDGGGSVVLGAEYVA